VQSSQNWTQSSQDSSDWTQNLYANLDAGVMFQQSTTLYQSTSTPKEATFNPGFRGDIALGYNINKSLAVELDSGVLWNSIDKVGGVSLSSIPYPFNASFDTYTVPLLANIIYKVPLKGSLSPYVGVGVGGAATIASYTVGGNNVGDYNFVVAYQAEAGLKYNLTKNVSLGIGYEFFGMANPRWYFNSNLVSNHIKEDGFYTHSILVSFTWNF
jgi:opacity protein-like surface antigen